MEFLSAWLDISNQLKIQKNILAYIPAQTLEHLDVGRCRCRCRDPLYRAEQESAPEYPRLGLNFGDDI